MRPAFHQTRRPRAGFTLLEMLVVVALVVLMMMVLVQIFQAATGAMTVSRTYQELDQKLRMVDGTLRKDLTNLTANLTPPLNPQNGLGYFEYIENAHSDPQGEDTDDVLRMTVKAPDNQPFSGRMVVKAWTNPLNGQVWPAELITITSDHAEIIYFLRDGNLYRRVLLVAPEKQGAASAGSFFGSYAASDAPNPFGTAQLGTGAMNVGWLGLNDLSARPDFTTAGTSNIPILNGLGDLTNRENRFSSPRFCNLWGGSTVPTDGNTDGIPDFYPTLFPNAFPSGLVNNGGFIPTPSPSGATGPNYDAYPFPYLYRGMYSKPVFPSVHFLDATGASFNHAPVLVGDSIAIPNITNAAALSTWWGFPTWRETFAPAWLDPPYRMNSTVGGLPQFSGFTFTGAFKPLPPNSGPPVSDPFSDSAGSAVFLPVSTSAAVVNMVWRDDLLLTNVRSFDVKAFDANVWIFDNSLPGYRNTGEGYVDLGYLDNPQLQSGKPLSAFNSAVDGYGTFANSTQAQTMLQGFGHEGRMPPVPTVFNALSNTLGPGDFRSNPLPQYQNGTFFNTIQDVGENSASTLRMMRTYDTWSTTYTNAPTYGWNALGTPLGISQAQGDPTVRPLYPSFPAPYPIAMRGLQIQIRVVDPSNEHIKILTIRQDLSDKI